jgi:hypothetical protein
MNGQKTNEPSLSNPWSEADLENIEKLFYPESGGSTSDVIAAMPDLPGLYLVFSSASDFDIGSTGTIFSRTLVYVGVSTRSLKVRWRNHHLLPLLRFMEKIGVDVSIYHWAFLPNLLPDATLLQWERDLIKRFRPPLNGYGPEIIRSLYGTAQTVELLPPPNQE